MVVSSDGLTKTWDLPRDLLANSSPYFAAALNGGKTDYLLESDIDAFALFIRWLYIGEISGKVFRSENQASGDEMLGLWGGTGYDAPFAATQVYLQACILGEKLGSPIFLDLAMLQLIKCHTSEAIMPQTILVAFEHSAPGSKLRQFAIDQLRYDLRFHQPGKYADAYIAAAIITEDFGLDFLRSCLDAGRAVAVNPAAHRQRYVQVLTVTEEE